MYKVTIYNYPSQTTREFEFTYFADAHISFTDRCNAMDYDYEHNGTEWTAGGIGHDNLITLSYEK